jgi:hypothetical protein
MHVIVYKSKNLISGKNLEKEIQNIISVAKDRNSKEDITGILIFNNNHFLQIIEGSKKSLKSLMADIENDKRHKDIEYLIDEPIKRRGFDSWNMEIFNTNDNKKFSFENLQKLTRGFRENLLTKSDDLMDFYKSLLQ